MNIAIDVMGILDNTKKNKDTDSYTAAQLKTLLALDKQNKYFLLNLYDDILLKDLLQYSNNTNEYYFNTGKDHFLWSYPKLIGEIYQNFIMEHKIDLFFLTSSDNHNFPIKKSWFKNTNFKALYGIKTERTENLEETTRLTLKSISGITSRLQQMQKSSNNKKFDNIAFFTPLPPIESGISDYSVDIICQLAKHFSIDVFIDTGYTHNCLLPHNVNVYEHDNFHKRYKKYDKLIFQMGNNPFHKYMVEYIRKFHGVVVLHDCNLHDLLLTITYRDKINNYEKMLSYDYKDEVNELIWAIHDGKRHSDFIANGFVTNFADIVIVHSKWGKKQLLLKNIEANVEHINLYAQIPNYSFEESYKVKQSAKKKLQIDEQDIVIAAFGFLSESKRCMPSLHAIRSIIKEFPHTRMIYVGKIVDNLKEEFFSYTKQNNLQERVSLTGFTSLETFLLYIESADICLNLRFPYHGETSATLTRILMAGKCVIINDIGSFSEIPDDCCVKIPSPENMLLKEEEELIYKALKNLINSTKKRSELGLAARKYAEEELDLNKITQQYINVLSRPSKQRVLTNNILSQIKKQVKNIKDENILTLARTLAYTMQDIDILKNGKTAGI